MRSNLRVGRTLLSAALDVDLSCGQLKNYYSGLPSSELKAKSKVADKNVRPTPALVTKSFPGSP